MNNFYLNRRSKRNLEKNKNKNNKEDNLFRHHKNRTDDKERANVFKNNEFSSVDYKNLSLIIKPSSKQTREKRIANRKVDVMKACRRFDNL